jgi:hypothetical protein
LANQLPLCRVSLPPRKSWELKFSVQDPHHNHPASHDASGHTVNQKLTASLYDQMKKLGNAGLKPAAILKALRKTNPDKTILATISTIYSSRKKAQQEMLQGISPIMHLNQSLTKSDFTTTTKVNDNGKLQGIFFCRSRSVELLSSYHYILLLDCTYKTNKYKMPLLHIAGVTGANKTFTVAFCFIAEETQSFYEWALESLLNIFNSHKIPLPQVILTDREQSLINSLPSFAPDSYHMLCTWHIQKNLVTNSAKTIKNKQEEAQMLQHWSNLFQMKDQSDFCASFGKFALEYGPSFQEYTTSNWLLVVKK